MHCNLSANIKDSSFDNFTNSSRCGATILKSDFFLASSQMPSHLADALDSFSTRSDGKDEDMMYSLSISFKLD